MAISTAEVVPDLAFQVAKEQEEKEEKKELPPNIERQQKKAIETFRKTPQRIEENFGNMVLERVFPEFQLDDDVKYALSKGLKIRSNVTGELINPEEIADHWILPRGEQLSKSTGAIYFPLAATRNADLRNSFLFWEFENVKGLLESNDPVIPKFSVITVAGEKSLHEKATEGSAHTFDTLIAEEGTDYEFAEEIRPPHLGDWSSSGEFGATHTPGKETRDPVYDNDELSSRATVTSIKGKRNKTELEILEPDVPHHPESRQEVHTLVPTRSTTEVPLPIDGEGSTIAEKLWHEIGPQFPSRDAARRSAEDLIFKYPPVLISQDLVILRTRVEGSKKFDFLAYAKSGSSDDRFDGWQKRLFSKSEDLPLEITQWLGELEKRKLDGKHESGFHTAALSVQPE